MQDRYYRETTEYEKMYVINHHESTTAYRIAETINMPVEWVHEFCKWMKIECLVGRVVEVRPMKQRTIPPVKSVYVKPIRQEKKVVFIRPPSTYTNIRTPYGIASELHSF